MNGCKETGCVNTKVVARGWCMMHYSRWKAGRPMDAAKGEVTRPHITMKTTYSGTDRLCHQCNETKHYSRFYAGMKVCMACWRGREKNVQPASKRNEVPAAYEEWRREFQKEWKKKMEEALS